MSRIKSRHTKPEKTLREVLRNLGLQYRLDSKLPGRPDMKIKGKKILIFLDGCFWHGCPKHYIAPKSNPSFWQKKIRGNQERDYRQRKLLKQKGYKIIRVWEHEIKFPKRLQKRLRTLLIE